jgi:hypothetical protein
MNCAGKFASKRGRVFEGIVILGVGHRAGFEPAVEDIGDAFRVGAAALRARQGEVVDAMRVDVFDLGAGGGFEVGDAAEAGLIGAGGAAPDGERGAPEAVARDVPVAGVGEPVAKSLLAPTASGTQWMVSLWALMRSRSLATRTKRAGTAL